MAAKKKAATKKVAVKKETKVASKKKVVTKKKASKAKKRAAVRLNKNDVVSRMAEQGEMTKTAAEKALNIFTSIVNQALNEGDSIALLGFGTFTTSNRSARTGRHPGTGEIIKIPATTVPVFRAGKALKEAVK